SLSGIGSSARTGAVAAIAGTSPRTKGRIRRLLERNKALLPGEPHCHARSSRSVRGAWGPLLVSRTAGCVAADRVAAPTQPGRRLVPVARRPRPLYHEDTARSARSHGSSAVAAQGRRRST